MNLGVHKLEKMKSSHSMWVKNVKRLIQKIRIALFLTVSIFCFLTTAWDLFPRNWDNFSVHIEFLIVHLFVINIVSSSLVYKVKPDFK